ncbi:MAG: LamG domain-containing protein [Methanoregula sp.]|nr:LamG domain-containing protein [Methanoregula sp.]
MHMVAGWKLCAGIFLLLLVATAGAASDGATGSGPVVYLNFNEGSGNLALDASGHGSTGTIHGTVSRVNNGGCVKALLLPGTSYVSVPYSSLNHPADAITVSLWFYENATSPQALVSTYNNGGYRLGFDDGNDLWWNLALENGRDVSVPIQHEMITPGEWHYVTGTYDGESAKLYLDGVLRNKVNATGAIRYTSSNYVMIGADAGTADQPQGTDPELFAGGIDEVRIYSRALSYSEVMNDRLLCSVAPGTGILALPNATAPVYLTSGTQTLKSGENATVLLTFANRSEEGTWRVAVPPGSRLVVRAYDEYPAMSPDEWYIELKDNGNRVTRAVAFPNTNNAPVSGFIPSGDATVLIHYFEGTGRFPASVSVSFECITAPGTPAAASIPTVILEYPIIVIYSASWMTLIALVLVIFWIHKRNHP